MNNNTGLQKFSPSMILDYISCPKLFYYRYIAKIQLPQKQIHLLFGSAVHAAIEEIYGQRDPYPVFESTFDINKLMEDEKTDYTKYIELGKEMIKNYAVEHETLDALYDLNNGESELYIRRQLINPLTKELLSIPISGRIDRLTRSGKIVEYKTAKAPWDPSSVQFRVQTLLYNLWYYSEYGVLPEETLYIILLKKYKKVGKKENEVMQVLSNHTTFDELASIFEEVELILNKVKNGMFDRPLGYHPIYCDCNRYENALKEKEIITK